MSRGGEHFDPPGLGRLVELGHNGRIDARAFLEGPIQLALADLTPERGLRQLRDGEAIVRDPIGGPLGIQHFEVQDSIDGHLNIVPRDADLLRDIRGLFFQGVFVADGIDERDQNVKSRVQHGGKLPESLHDIGVLLRHDPDRFGEEDEDDKS